MESKVPSLESKAGLSPEVVALREQLSSVQESYRRLSIEQEKLKEELQRRNDLLEKKESASQAQLRKIEAAETRIRELVHSEGEAAYRSRAIAGKMASLEQSVASSENARKTLEKKLQNSQLQVNELTGQVQSQAERLKEMRSASDRKSSTTGELERQNRDLEAKLARATGNLELFQSKLQSLQRQLSDRQTELELAQQKEKLVQKEREVIAKELEEAKEKAKSYRDAMTSVEQALLSSKHQLSEVENTLERNELELDKAKLAAARKDHELAELQASLENLTQDLRIEQLEKSELIERIDQLEADLVEEASAKDELIKAKGIELSALKEKVKAYAQSSTSERANFEELNKAYAALKGEFEERTTQLKELKAFADRLKPAYETLKEHFTELQALSKGQVSQIDQLNQKLLETRSSNQALDSNYQELKEKIVSVSSEQELAEEKVDGLEVEKRALEAEIRKLLKLREEDLETIASLSTGIEESSQALELAKSSLKELEELIKARTKQNQDLENELAVKTEELSELSKSHLKLEEEHKSLKLSNEKLQTNLKEILKQRNQLLEHKKQLDTLISSGGEALALVKEELDTISADRNRLLAALEDEQMKCLKAREELEKSISQHDTSAAAQDSSHRAAIELLEQQLADTKEALEAKVCEAEVIITRTRQELGIAQDKLQEAESNIKSLGQKHSRELSEAELVSINTNQEIGRLEEASVVLKGELETLKEHSSVLQAKVEDLETELQRRGHELAVEGKARQDVEQASKAQLQQLQELNLQLERSQKERISLRQVLDKLQKISKERLETAKSALSTREGQILRLREALTAKERELAGSQNKLQNASSLEKALRGATEDLRHMLADKEAMIEELEWHLGLVYDTIEGLEVDLETSGAQHLTDRKEFTAQIAKLELVQQELKLELSSLRDSHRELKDELQLEHSTLADLKDKLARQTARLDEAQASLNNEYEYSAHLSDGLSQALAERSQVAQRMLRFQESIQALRDRLTEETPLEKRPLGLGDVEAISEMLAYRASCLQAESLSVEKLSGVELSLEPDQDGDPELSYDLQENPIAGQDLRAKQGMVAKLSVEGESLEVEASEDEAPPTVEDFPAVSEVKDSAQYQANDF